MLFTGNDEGFQERMRNEILSQVCTRSDAYLEQVLSYMFAIFQVGNSTPKLSDMSKTPLVESFLLEVQRLRPIAPLALPRLTTEDCVISGQRVYKLS